MTFSLAPAPEPASDEKPERVWIPRETWRQEKAVVFARDAIVGAHKFLAHDRAKANRDKSHLWQARRGVRKGTPDTQLVLPNGKTIWFEFKAPGKRPDEDQERMLADLRAMGHAAGWGVTIEDMRRFWVTNGVPLVTNAEYRALVLDGLVDSRIAKAEGAVPGPKKKRRAARKGPVGKVATVAWARRNAGKLF
jgi:VRR-NUC domain